MIHATLTRGAGWGSPRMPDQQLQLIQDLLQEQRDAQHRANTMLADLRIDVASMQRLQEGQSSQLAEIRVDIRQIYERLREAEMQTQRIPAVEQLYRELERRLRALEQDGREHKVVAGAMATGAKAIWHYLAAALVAALIAGIVSVAREGAGSRQIAAAHGIGEPAVR